MLNCKVIVRVKTLTINLILEDTTDDEIGNDRLS